MTQRLFIRDGSGYDFEVVITDDEGQAGLIGISDDDLIDLHISTARHVQTAVSRSRKRAGKTKI